MVGVSVLYRFIKHYFNFIVSDNIHNSITRMHEKNVENGLDGAVTSECAFQVTGAITKADL